MVQKIEVVSFPFPFILENRVCINHDNLFQPGGEKAIEIVESKRKELAALMKASLPPCDRMGLICRFLKIRGKVFQMR